MKRSEEVPRKWCNVCYSAAPRRSGRGERRRKRRKRRRRNSRGKGRRRKDWLERKKRKGTTGRSEEGKLNIASVKGFIKKVV